MEKFERPEEQNFVDDFVFKYSVPFMVSHLQVIFAIKTHFVGTEALNFALRFICESIIFDKNMEKLKRFVMDLLTTIVIPRMQMTEKEFRAFGEDPVEYIRSLNDFKNTPKHYATIMLQRLTEWSSVERAAIKEEKRLTSDKDKRVQYLNKFLKHTQMPEDRRHLIGADVEREGKWEKQDDVDIEFLD